MDYRGVFNGMMLLAKITESKIDGTSSRFCVADEADLNWETASWMEENICIQHIRYPGYIK